MRRARGLGCKWERVNRATTRVGDEGIEARLDTSRREHVRHVVGSANRDTRNVRRRPVWLAELVSDAATYNILTQAFRDILHSVSARGPSFSSTPRVIALLVLYHHRLCSTG